jgi:hypothetical protein
MLHLILGSHSHVPSGASESEFQYVYENKILPFVSNLYRYSNIQAVLHYSGVLLYWIERTHPEIFMLMEDMVARKQVEVLSGGFYEPMLPLIPLQDRIGQIELMTTYLRKHFGKRPLGCWIPGFAWEQPLAAALAASDMQYTFLSQDQFKLAGLDGKDLFFPCISEDQGKLIIIFPVSVSIGKALAEKSVSQVFTDMQNDMQACGAQLCCDESVITVFPQKPSSSEQEAPDTAWHRFFEELSLSKDFIETIMPAKILKNSKIYKKASFPNSSSIENNYSPRRFIIDNCEANGIYSKMIFTNVLINQLKGDKSRKQNAREEFWKAQDSCLFIPGGGIHRNELRKSAYSSLLRAEKLSREKGKFNPSLIQHDFDLDGVKEFLFQDAKINCYVQQKGAGVFELDYLPKDWNYLDCGSSGVSNKNMQRRAAFIDALLPFETETGELEKKFPESFDANSIRLCFNEQYEPLAQVRNGKSCFKLPAMGTPLIQDAQVPYSAIEIEKCYMLKKDILTVNYTVKNTGAEKLWFSLVTEIDFAFAGKGEEYVRFYTIDGEGKDIHAERILTNTASLKIQDIVNEVQIILGSVKPFSGCLITASDSIFYQADRIIAKFDISLDGAETWINEFSLKFSH